MSRAFGRTRSKRFRSWPISGHERLRSLNLAEAGKLFLVRGPWIDAFVDEVSRFPSGRHDDQIHAVSVAVSMLAKKEYRAVGM